MEALEENILLQKVADTITDKPVVVTVDVRPDNFIHRLFIKWGWMPDKHTFTIKPLTVGNMYRIAGKALSVDEGLFDGGITPGLMNGLFKHTDAIVYIVAVGIQNSKKEPSSSLIKLIREEFTVEDIHTVVGKVLLKMDVENFINTIAWIKGADALKTKASPEVKR